ncbi:hypothetical protein BDN71DRAFT_1482744 [Pleurotus eryngii]|uniref:Uncharacterized protein n=1 Tax=Pleurotus eryngii TaxID=5323 RepID=A0A9P5ZWS0_PLEER|nr:hypothetical protein BDN71DRAFT_1482744 [Pleurotus eryngii]
MNEPIPPSPKSDEITQKFVNEIRSATLDNGNLNEDTIARLCHPIEGPVDISNPNTRLSLDIFLAVTNASEQTYDAVQAAVTLHYPDTKILSYHLVKKLVADISGVMSVVDDMCIKLCLTFTGPFANDNVCSICGEHCYDQLKLQLTGKKIPHQQFHTIPLGPQLQALCCSPDSSTVMAYRDKKTHKVLEMIQTIQSPDDMVTEYLSLYKATGLTSNDTLYQNKASDMWLYIWIIEDVIPGTRYKKKRVLPSGFIPGPLKPKILNSFIFQGIHHVSALQQENNGCGMHIWDACLAAVIYSRIIFAMGTADAMGMPEMVGEVGHHGALGCQLCCKMKGWHKPYASHYFMPHLQPLNYTVPDCNHPDIDIRSLQTGSAEDYWHDFQADYECNRKATGLSKPSIFTGLVPLLMFPIPQCWVLDLMHLIKLNIPNLLISLWRGTIKCEATDNKNTWPWRTFIGDTWIEHGKSIAACQPYFPTSFHCPPRNPAEKINSGYKATEYYLYIFGLGPVYFQSLLPHPYWHNLCRLVHGVRIILQRSITGQQLCEAHLSLVQFVEEYELHYYQHRVDRMHFCCPCIHTLLHTAPEVACVGPGAYSSQFTVERTIGDLGQEIKQPSNPFLNLSQQGIHHSQVNALKTIQNPIPHGAIILGNGFIFLRPCDRISCTLHGPVGNALLDSFGVAKIAQTAWKEKQKASCDVHIFRMVKVGGEEKAFALVSLYSHPDADLLEDSYGALWVCDYLGLHNLHVVEAESIISVVSIQLLPPLPHKVPNRWFVVEKPGMDDLEMLGQEENMGE